jgi:short-subunit dehydrogenase
MSPDTFTGKVVIVTGASAGIGRSLALQLAAQGAKLAIAARRLDRLEQVAQECRVFGSEVITVQTDVSDEKQCQALVERTVNSFGQLDLLVNNAGLAVSALFADFPDLRLFKHTVDINFFGAVYCTYYALPHLKASKGRILAISSLAGKAPLPFNTPYVSSKYALNGFLDALRMELQQTGVSVTIVCPYWVVSEFHQAQLNKRGVPRGERGRAFYTDKMMTADQCARISLKAALRRRREVLMGPGTFAVWLKLISPALMDWFSVKVFLEPIIRRARQRNRKEST